VILAAARGALLALALTGCVSSVVKPYVGKPIEAVFIAHGRPANVFDLANGRRAFQYYLGGGTFTTPAVTTGSATTVGNFTSYGAVTTGGNVISSPGCLVTFIARPDGMTFIVEEYRIPGRLVC